MPNKFSDKVLDEAAPLSSADEITRDDFNHLDILKQPVWVFDIERRAMWWANTEAIRLWNGETLDDLLMRDWSTDMSDATRARLDDYLARFGEESHTVNEQWTFYPKGEGVITVKCVCSGVRIENGRLAMLVEGRLTDFAEAGSEDLRGIEALRHTSVMISLYNTDQRLLYQNPSAAHAFSGADSFSSHFEIPEEAKQVWQTVIKDGYHTGEYRFHTNDGTVWHGIDCTRTVDPVTVATAILVNQRNIQNEWWSESILSWNARVLEQIAANKPLCELLKTIVRMTEATEPGMICSIHLLDEQGQRLRCAAAPTLPDFYNKAIDGVKIGPTVGSCGAAAYSGKTVIAEDILKHPNWEPYRGLAQKAGLRACWSVPVKNAEGRVTGTFAAYYRTPRVPKKEQLHLLGMAVGLVEMAIKRHDARQELITARQHADDARKEAESANKAKSEFLASMSHELRTPLNAVLGFAQMLQLAPDSHLSPAQNEYVECILSGGHHLLDLINEILDLARLEADQVSLSLENVNTNEVVADSVALTSSLGGSRGIKVIDKFAPGQLIFLRTDRLRFKQILINLLSNAIKYNKDGGTVTVDGRKTDEGFLRLYVTDTGIGIAEADYVGVFQLFHRLGADPMKAREGTGIGLSVSRLLVERMAGRIGFKSEEGIGSTFWVELPLSSNEEAFIWTDVMRTGVDVVDKDHQVIISLTNRISHKSFDKKDLDSAIGELIDYTLYHFQREETIMEICSYPELEEHRHLHCVFVSKLNDLADEWCKERDLGMIHKLRVFLRSWWISHIVDADVGISRYTKGKEQDIWKALKYLEEPKLETKRKNPNTKDVPL